MSRRRSLGRWQWAPGKIQPCGTDAGYERHRYRNEIQCDACLAAHATRERERWQGRRQARTLAGPSPAGRT